MLLTVGPSGQEQEMLELLNRMRMDPAAELPLLVAEGGPQTGSAIRFFETDMAVVAEQWKELVPAPPLAWNDQLTAAALGHNHQMLLHDEQSHQLPGEPSLRDRTAAQGYPTNSFLAENVFAFSHSVPHAHAAFAIDWGVGPHGIQDPPGHRIVMMDSRYREVGISIIAGQPFKHTGPNLVTQNFGGVIGGQNAFVLGVVYHDTDDNGVYRAAEALSNVTIQLSGSAGTFTTTSFTHGGYQLQAPPGAYELTATGGGLGQQVIRIGDIAVGSQNVKHDVVKPLDLAPPSAELLVRRLTEGGGRHHVFRVVYEDPTGVDQSTLRRGNVLVSGPDGFRRQGELVSTQVHDDGQRIIARYQVVAPGRQWTDRDQGVYTVRLRAGEVGDLDGNVMPAQLLGRFAVRFTEGSALGGGGPLPLLHLPPRWQMPDNKMGPFAAGSPLAASELHDLLA